MVHNKGLGRARAGTHALVWVSSVIAACVAVAACGAGGAKTAPATVPARSSTPAPAGAATTPPTVTETTIPRYGAVLTDAHGFVLYTYTADDPGGPGCHGSCLALWRPLLLPAGAGQPAAVGLSGLGTLARPEGVQVTYHRQPLYRFVGDQQPGAVNGQGVTDSGGTWSLATVAGPVATATTAASSPASSSTVPPAVTSAPSGAAPTVAANQGPSGPRSTAPAATPAPTAPATTSRPTSPPPTPPTAPATTRPTAPPSTALPGY